MQLQGRQDLGQARRLRDEPRRPRRVVLDYLDAGVAATGTNKVKRARRKALGWVAIGGHIVSFAASLAPRRPADRLHVACPELPPG